MTTTADNKRVALITGATGLLGRAICERLAAAGVDLCLACSSSEADAKQLAESLSDKHGVTCSAVCFDVTSVSEVQTAVGQVAESHGRLDILVAAHGVAPQQFLRFTKEEDIQQALRINTEGTIHCVTAVLPHMQRSNFGRVILLGSAAADGRPRSAAYAASKAALNGLVRSAAREHSGHGITFNVIAPAVVEGGPATQSEQRDKLLEEYPLGRFIAPEEVAATAAFLASDDAATITGQQIFIDGGRF